MDPAEEVFGLSIQIGDIIREYSDMDGIQEHQYISRCISVAHRTMQVWIAGENFFVGPKLIDLPQPVQLKHPYITKRRLPIRPNVKQYLEYVSEHYAIDAQSVIAWGSQVKQLLEKLQRDQKIFIDGPKGRRQYHLQWFQT